VGVILHSANMYTHTQTHTNFLYLFIGYWAHRLIPEFGYTKQNCNKHGYAGILSSRLIYTPSDYVQELGMTIISRIILRNFHADLHNGCTNLVPIIVYGDCLSLLHLHHLLLFVFLMMASLTGVRILLVLICISFIAKKVENISSFISHLSVFVWELFSYLAYLLIGFFCPFAVKFFELSVYSGY
jgi:hypothetical protein